MQLGLRKESAGSWGWAGLALYILLWHLFGILRNFELLTTAWRRALAHPYRRWIVIIAWIMTTKHLFFGGFLPKLDPFHAIGMTATHIKRLGGKQ